MTSRVNCLVSTLALTIILVTASQLHAETAKKVLTMDDYGLWRTVTSTQLSNDGDWCTYDYRKPEADDDAPDERNLQIKNLSSSKVYEVPFAISPAFSDDSNWIAYMIDVDSKEAKKLRAQKKSVERKVELLNLKTGDKVSWDNATSFTFSKSSNALVIRKPKTKGVEHAGSDLVVHNLDSGTEYYLGSVSSYEINKSGALLAYTRDAANQTGNGLYIMDLASGLQTPLDQAAATYSRMTWDEQGTALAALKGEKDKKFLQQDNQLIAFTEMSTDSPVRHELNPVESRGFPDDMVISEKGRLSWNTDATKVFFGIKAQEADPKHKKSEKDGQGDDDKEKKHSQPEGLDIWHWKDVRIQPVQRARANRERNFTYRSVYNLKGKKFVQLADETMRNITITRDGKWGVGSDERAYIHDWKPLLADYYRVDTKTGKRRPMFEALNQLISGYGSPSMRGMSPDSKYFMYWNDANYWVYDLESRNTVNLTKDAAVSFADMEYDFYGERPPYGVSGWTKDGKGIILNHRYDLWLQPLNGDPAINLTGGVGAENEIVLRYIRLDREERFIDLSKPVLLSAYGEWTKKAGFYKLDVGNAESGSFKKPERLVFKDNSFGRLTKAKDADRFMFTIESFTESPDYYVADATFNSPQRITDANPQQKEFNWGHRVLYDYTNDDGVRLQGSLAIPDTRKPGERLPMIVSFYEKRSQNLNRYLRPRYASNPIADLMEAVSKGYMILSPDIHFNIGTPEEDKLECIEAAAAKAVELGYADPDRIALAGHSYSAYGGTYIAARSDKFAAGVVMAGTMNFISDFNHLWGSEPDRKGGSGVNAHRYNIYEQGRMGTNPYDDFDVYWWQGPISHVTELDTPLLYIHGESDNTVAWIEGVELYNAMRFNGKNIIFLSYAKEGHSLSNRINKIDFTRRMLEYLDHHLMGKSAEDWIANGVPFLEKNK